MVPGRSLSDSFSSAEVAKRFVVLWQVLIDRQTLRLIASFPHTWIYFIVPSMGMLVSAEKFLRIHRASLHTPRNFTKPMTNVASSSHTTTSKEKGLCKYVQISPMHNVCGEF